jgi:hypothetical protein
MAAALFIWTVCLCRPSQGTESKLYGCRGMAQATISAVDRMTDTQAALLRKLAFDAYEPEAFQPNLTQTEAEQRINALKAKLKLMDGPPHTL